MTLDQFIDKYGTHGSGLVLSDAAAALEKDKPFLAKVLRELERDLSSVLTSSTEPICVPCPLDILTPGPLDGTARLPDGTLVGCEYGKFTKK